MEWGPRALGNRSILGDPRRADMKDILNVKIKRRESFRPFAPSILRESVPEWFEQDGDVPFMMQVYPIRAEKRALIPAVTHVDGSGRLQTVQRDSNPLYYRLIEAFRDLTGVPMVLNTSFNENEPVVCKPEEALECFLRTKMDVLVVGSFMISPHRRQRTSVSQGFIRLSLCECPSPDGRMLTFFHLLMSCSIVSQLGSQRRIFEIGAGNGALTNALAAKGHEVIGIDYSTSGVENANRSFPNLRIERGQPTMTCGLASVSFPSPCVFEVVEHLYFPRLFAQRAFDVLEPGGTLVVSTPFHGYWKNLALAVSGKLDAHFTALWDGGHIKFWSIKRWYAACRSGVHRHRLYACRPLGPLRNR